MGELRMLPFQKFLSAGTCRRMADFYLSDCRRRIALARQHPELAGMYLSAAREILREAEFIMKHSRETHLSAMLVAGTVSIPDVEVANG